jgi:hypothetical protein
VTEVFEASGKVHHSDISGEFAHVVQSVNFSWSEKGKSRSEKAIEFTPPRE